MVAMSAEEVGFVPDDDGRGGVTVMLGETPQSHVDLADPTHLVFDYVQYFAAALTTLPPGPIGVTHVGGGGLSLARHVNAVRPGSPQIVLEPHTALTEAVRRELPLPRQHRIRVRPLDGRTGVAQLADASADVVVLDAYAGGRVPADLTTGEFLADVARVLKPGGLFLANLADEPGLRYVLRVVATARQHLPEVALVASVEVLKGRRFGNAVLVASRAPVDADELARQVRRIPFPAGVRGAAELGRQAAGAQPFSDADPGMSPPPPPAKGWRVR